MTTALSENLDAELPVIEAILAGDEGAFEEFMRRHARWVRGIIYAVLGDCQRLDDVSQQVWSTVWQQSRTLKEPQKWRSWLYRLARNAALDAGRENTRRRRLKQSLKKQARLSTASTPQPISAMTQEQHQLLTDAMRALPALYREPFVLRHLEGWSYQEIAELLKMPVDTVETRLVRARRQLREALRERI